MAIKKVENKVGKDERFNADHSCQFQWTIWNVSTALMLQCNAAVRAAVLTSYVSVFIR